MSVVPLVAALVAVTVEAERPYGWLGVALCLGLAIAADFRPVPLDERGSEVSLAFVFIIVARVLFGWPVAVPLAAASVLVAELARRRPLLRASFNSAAYSLAASATFLPALLLVQSAVGVDRVVINAFVDGAIFVVVNVALVSGAITLAEGTPYRRTLLDDLRKGGAAYAVMASLAALTAALWTLQPLLLLLLVGPVCTLVLYQRSALRSRLAQRDALTDSLTGLGNHRAYQGAVRDWVETHGRSGSEFSLCLIDVDDFKAVNDNLGHPAGDELLKRIGELLSAVADADAYRCGGDEFAVLIRRNDSDAVEEIARLQRTLAASLDRWSSVTFSAGIATYPAHGRDADELQRIADTSLYWSKRHGKNRACAYSPSFVRTQSTAELEREAERSARLRAATNLVKFLDAKDASTANHSEIVATLAAAIGTELGLDEETVAQLRLAGLLHDLGKIGVPDRILQAPRLLEP
ncbi:MAG TPA: diguanylate cyclase, partial [Gaiellaceae bacterium]|nr:diguanylate cyclase [Gaiellaceae bacterium]